MASNILLYNQKGGVGKTSLTFQIANILAARGKSVLVVDLDAQCNLTNYYGMFISKHSPNDVSNIFMKEYQKPLNEIITKTELNVDLVKGNKSISDIEILLPNQIDSSFVLHDYINNYSDQFNEYDYIFYDLAPTASRLATNVFIGVDKLFLIVDVDINAVLACGDVQQRILNISQITHNAGRPVKMAGVSKIIVNKIDNRNRKQSSEYIEFIQNSPISDKIIEPYLPYSVELRADSDKIGKKNREILDELVDKMFSSEQQRV